jgi:hypothetical protein
MRNSTSKCNTAAATGPKSEGLRKSVSQPVRQGQLLQKSKSLQESFPIGCGYATVEQTHGLNEAENYRDS